jgi:hypothetical protein
MTSDDRLRTELDTLERSAPAALPPLTDSGRLRRWLSGGLVGGTIVVAAALTAVAVGPLRSLPLGAASPSPNPPAMAETRVGDFILSISSPKTAWTTDEAIEVTASLTYVGEEPAVDVGIGTGLVFTAHQISGGNAEFGGFYHPICLNQHLDRGVPRIQSFVKSGEIHETGPFDDAFFRDPDLHLPPGDWRLTAMTEFANDLGCGNDIEIRASVVLTVVAGESVTPAPETPAGTPSLSPTPSPAPSARVCMSALASGILGADADGNPVLYITEDALPVSIIWSYPGTFRVDSSEPLTIYDREGNVVATQGDYVTLSGGSNADDTEFHACGVVSSEPSDSDDVTCAVPADDCDLALAAAGPPLYEGQADPRSILVGWGRGLRVWHAEVHACWGDGRYILIDVIGPLGAEPPAIGEVSVSVRQDAWDNPPCD